MRGTSPATGRGRESRAKGESVPALVAHAHQAPRSPSALVVVARLALTARPGNKRGTQTEDRTAHAVCSDRWTVEGDRRTVLMMPHPVPASHQ